MDTAREAAALRFAICTLQTDDPALSDELATMPMRADEAVAQLQAIYDRTVARGERMRQAARLFLSDDPIPCLCGQCDGQGH